MSSTQKRIVIIGATSAIAEHCARLWLQKDPASMVLVGRNQDKTERVAADLRVRSPQSDIQVVQADFINSYSIDRLVQQIADQGPVDIVLIAHGLLPDQQKCQENLAECDTALIVNGNSPVLFAEALVGRMLKAGSGTVAVIGSVAGDRGRKSNYVYGAAKGLVTRYIQGLQHRLAGTGVKAILIKPGPVATPMTAHLDIPAGQLARVEDVAKDIVDGIASGKPVIYTPSKWAIIMMIVCHLPRFIFNKINI